MITIVVAKDLDVPHYKEIILKICPKYDKETQRDICQAAGVTNVTALIKYWNR